jgi:hypothetical protein
MRTVSYVDGKAPVVHAKHSNATFHGEHCDLSPPRSSVHRSGSVRCSFPFTRSVMTRPRITLIGGTEAETIVVLASIGGKVVWSGEYAPDVRLADVIRDVPPLFL